MTALGETPVGAAFALQRTMDTAELIKVGVQDDDFAEYSDLVQRLIILLGARADEDGPWQDSVRILKGLRSTLTLWPGDVMAALRTIELPAGWPDQAVARLRAFGEAEALLVGQAWAVAQRMGSDERRLGEILRRLIQVLPDVGQARVIVKPRFVGSTTEWLRQRLDHVPAVVPQTALGDEVDLERLIIIGPMSWYADHLRALPRAKRTFVLSHAWVKDRTNPVALLADLSGDEREVGPTLVQKSIGTSRATREIRIDATALLPGFSEADLERMARRVVALDRGEGASQDREESVEARMFVLASGEVVFLPTADGSRRDVAEPTSAGVSIARIPVALLGVGMFLLVRRSGAADHLAVMADRMLAAAGEDPAELRRAHSRWQDVLRQYVDARGLAQAADELRAAGVRVANPQNVSRWMSGEGLGLQKDTHFRALLKQLGLHSEARSILQMTRLLRRAHQSAGARVRALLVERAEQMSPAELEAAGHVDVELEEEDGGTLMLARIEQVADATVHVPVGRIGVATEVD